MDSGSFDLWGLVSCLIATAGFIVVCIQLGISTRNKRAEFLFDIVKNLRFDSGMQDAAYMIDYSLNWYNEDFHKDGETQKVIDRYFSLLTYICYMYRNKSLTENEFKYFKYELSRVKTNSEDSSIAYLWNLNHFARAIGSSCPFEDLIQYGKENEWFKDKDFDNPKSVCFTGRKFLLF